MVGQLALGRVVDCAGVGLAFELDPYVVGGAACAHVRWKTGSFARVGGGGFDALGEADEEGSKDGDRTEDDDEPHLGQHPRVQRVDGVGDVLGLCDGGDGYGFVDSRDARAVKAKSVRLDPQRHKRGWSMPLH